VLINFIWIYQFHFSSSIGEKMAVYCPSCGKSIPGDSRVCAYCGKPIPAHGLQTAPEPEQKNNHIGLIIAVVLVLVIIVPIAIAATVYVYVSGMIGSTSHISTSTTPDIIFVADNTNHKITVVSSSSSLVVWSDLVISGAHDTSSLVGFVTAGDEITGCSGYIIITYIPTHAILYSYTFS
jgi:hypothetical protein